MRISSITTTQFQGLHHAALAVSEPVLLVSGNNGAGKSSLLDAISMALTGEPRRVSRKKDLAQLITEGQKKGEAHLTWVDTNGDEQVSWIMLPKGNTAPLIDSPYLPFVLNASKFSALDNKERRKLLFDLTGSSASTNEAAKRLLAHGADAALVEKIKPMLRAGFPAAAEQAKDYAAEARGAWKATTGEVYGSEKAEGWEPEVLSVSVSQDEIDTATAAAKALEQDLDEANQTLGAHKAAAQDLAGRHARMAELKELANLQQRRQIKLDNDQADLGHWQTQLAGTRGGKQGLVHDLARSLSSLQALARNSQGVQMALGSGITSWSEFAQIGAMDHVLEQYRTEHGPIIEGVAHHDLAKRAAEFQGYVDSLLRTVENSQRDLNASLNAAVQLAELTALETNAPSAEAIDTAEQVINELRLELDQRRAKVSALSEAYAATTGRDALIEQAANHHHQVQAWVKLAEALSPDGIPSEILKTALEPVNTLLGSMSDAAKWAHVQIRDDIEVTYGGRLYGLLSESEKWRCDALLAVAIARKSDLRLVTLDRFDVLQPSARPQILSLLLQLTQAGELDSAILAGTMKEALPKVPSGIQQVWIEKGQVAEPVSAAA